MKCIRIVRACTLSLACLGMLIPTPMLAAEATPSTGGPQTPPPVVADVQLHGGGMLWGQVVDANGNPQQAVSVTLRQADRDVATAVTNASGHFAVRGLRGGTCEIVAGQTHLFCRIWPTNTAPPAAKPGAMLVTGGGGVRGQTGPIGYWLGNPWIVAGVVAAAVSVPVIIHSHRTHRSASP